MISLNLLPPEQKEKVKKMAIYTVIENLIAGLFITIAFLGIILLLSKNILEKKYAYYTASVVTPSYQTLILNQNIKKINSELQTISSVQTNFKKWSIMLVELDKLIPDNIQITYLDLKSQEQEEDTLKVLEMKGKAITREKLLAFQENLENSSLFTQVESPISNILEQKNINFNFDLTVSKNFQEITPE
ncbi:PilN domain-containing protein [Candidatus Falkowbacteria bacterium]|nr:PilN domain-containing protein [Candidatus Falkowbacteria bacterium]